MFVITEQLKRRFIEKVMPVTESGCHIWMGCSHKTGYGRFGLCSYVIEYAHRVSWLIHKGKIPEGLYVLHKCDVRYCVNPDHLFLGTCKSNMQDAKQKNRMIIPKASYSSDENHQLSVLTNSQVIEIRNSKLNPAQLYRTGKYPVGYQAIWLAKTGRTFKDVPL